MPTIRTRIAELLFPDILQAAATAAVTVRVDDSAGWTQHAGAGPQDRPWSDHFLDLEDALEAWRKNFLIRRIVTLSRSYVVAGGIIVSSKHTGVNKFVDAFWNHPKNHVPSRMGPICDELTRSGEVFAVLFTNRIDGMSYLRLIPASQIFYIQTDPDDYELELAYHQTAEPGADPVIWLSPDHPDANALDEEGRLPPVMLHFAVNRPIGATRGEGDMGPILSWARRYAKWLEDRVRLNRIRTRQFLLDVQLADDAAVKDKKRQLQSEDPINAGIYVHGPGEEVTAHALHISAGDVADDGQALRLAVAAGANTALHYLGEGDTTNYATAKEMGEPAARFYTERQAELCRFLISLVTVAYTRAILSGKATAPRKNDYQLTATVTEAARADNLGLAQAAHEMVQALAMMKAQGWIDDTTACRLAFQFAGEAIGQEQIQDILAKAEPVPEPQPEPDERTEE